MRDLSYDFLGEALGDNGDDDLIVIDREDDFTFFHVHMDKDTPLHNMIKSIANAPTQYDFNHIHLHDHTNDTVSRVTDRLFGQGNLTQENLTAFLSNQMMDISEFNPNADFRTTNGRTRIIGKTKYLIVVDPKTTPYTGVYSQPKPESSFIALAHPVIDIADTGKQSPLSWRIAHTQDVDFDSPPSLFQPSPQSLRNPPIIPYNLTT